MNLKEALAALPDEDAAKELEDALVKEANLQQLEEAGAVDALVQHVLSKETSDAVKTSLAACLKTIGEQGSNGASLVANRFFEKPEAIVETEKGALLLFDILDVILHIRTLKRQLTNSDSTWKALLQHKSDDVVKKTCTMLSSLTAVEVGTRLPLLMHTPPKLPVCASMCQSVETLQALIKADPKNDVWTDEGGFLKAVHASVLSEKQNCGDMLTALELLTDSSTEMTAKMLKSAMMGKIIRLIGKAPFIHTRKLAHVLCTLSGLVWEEEHRDTIVTLVTDVLPGIFTNFSVANPAHAQSQEELARALVAVTTTESGCRAVLKGDTLKRMLPLLEANHAIKTTLAHAVCNLVTMATTFGLDASSAVPSLMRLVTQDQNKTLATRAACALSVASKGILEESLLQSVMGVLTQALKDATGEQKEKQEEKEEEQKKAGPAALYAVARHTLVASLADLCYSDIVKEIVRSGVVLALVFKDYKPGECRSLDIAAARLLSQLSFICSLKSDLKRDFLPEVEALEKSTADDEAVASEFYPSLFPASLQLFLSHSDQEPPLTSKHALVVASNDGEAIQQSVEAIAVAHDMHAESLMPKNRPTPAEVQAQAAACSVVLLVVTKQLQHCLPCRAYTELAMKMKKPVVALQQLPSPYSPWVMRALARRNRPHPQGDEDPDAIHGSASHFAC
ncbi:hypothetical protein PTSG_03169 [Salpingoeca rosetta]|uniref:Uncharacterized protein n=1 Tax=Salpingoeca rosetta (strain ATCC 50818 / BSB-021) TaxID=946362 RepID=F2U4F3_SALR5|nr:uncharacterized protein PTSG_03169 [Salpingoeca rosetta]EGD82519.1 hypothetical protein PTSG_03169 [Salpingoeca rosetta]|eukprot:XP_004995755.1 hypothetical protein PTSG_03169 [Salpingoeca rosetta]